MTKEDWEYYNIYGESETDAFILKKMLFLLREKEGFNFIQECQAAKISVQEAEAVEQWQAHSGQPPRQIIYRLLDYLMSQYYDVYLIALQYYIKYYKPY